MHHLVRDDVVEKLLRLLHHLGVQADVACAVVAASPLRLHPRDEVNLHAHTELRCPLGDKRRNRSLQRRLVEAEAYRRLVVLFDNREQVALPFKVGRVDLVQERAGKELLAVAQQRR